MALKAKLASNVANENFSADFDQSGTYVQAFVDAATLDIETLEDYMAEDFSDIERNKRISTSASEIMEEYADFFHSMRDKTYNNKITFQDKKNIILICSSIMYAYYYIDLKITMEQTKKLPQNKSNSEQQNKELGGFVERVTSSEGFVEPKAEGRSFAESLSSHRKAAKLTQKELSERSGVKQAHISELESSRYEPRLNTILALADALGLDPCALIPKGRGRG